MPNEGDLPEPLRTFARVEATRIRDSDFNYDFDCLVEAIKRFGPKKLVDIPAPHPGEPITGEHLAMINSSWRAPKHDDRFRPHAVYRFDVIIECDSSVLTRVEKVVYMLPPAWPTSPVTINNKTSKFGLKELAWTDLLVRARVYFVDQLEPVYLSSYIRLTEHGDALIRRS
jgi:hypothetical protein